jgi:ubiquinone/menaquinone biosynthesis C-methylase UbiE
MSRETIQAYDLPARVSSYDADMALMHPNRSRMVEIALEVVPFDVKAAFTVLDLGAGTGFFTQAVLRRYPNCRVIAVDGAASMVELAKTRLGAEASRVEFRVGDFRELSRLIPNEHGEFVFSSYALHHLTPEEKTGVVRGALSFLKPGGWFLNADLVTTGHERTEARIQDVRIQGIVQRASGRDERFPDAVSVRTFLDDLEARDHDKPLPVTEELRILKQGGLASATVFWLEYREAVTGGVK